ncbi:hypothetical protein DL991_10330 [Amycolatopsis sp. WAC 01375]|uniref:hypothetical protein n=1 Tax=Amycolatopsis sp. WAC 01375 TaxID=2203194 RepID=UPI000F77D9BC|nr:hypothetical protein [Amycolatopsis sp. WAC 01375]RSM80507.1 hypothetical protein DL991_10330 [Amycolatopsis sp. WAC 01375]
MGVVESRAVGEALLVLATFGNVEVIEAWIGDRPAGQHHQVVAEREHVDVLVAAAQDGHRAGRGPTSGQVQLDRGGGDCVGERPGKVDVGVAVEVVVVQMPARVSA